MKHIPVLLEETVSVLALRPDSVVVDATLGGGGHARRILEELDDRGVYVGIDADPTAIEALDELHRYKATVHLINDNFSNIGKVVSDLEITPTAILADLGWRSDQFESGQKGFSFQKDEPLLMTFGDPEKHVFTAYDVVNDWSEESLADIIYGFGEERASRRIARAIVEARENGPIKSSLQLAEIIESAIPRFKGKGRIHPATKTFQAIRIAVNAELQVLHELLNQGFDLLPPNGRMAIISFHSLEDRIVKQFFNEKIQAQEALKLIKKPIVATEEERATNPRSRSAKLRVIEKLSS
ncbi:16S rRNA (cytosine(1402)-N(4))-methyltransferase [Candidatus Kaiserbacteria bacterium CG10_big_fil_rev_8_21_14_0_10_44_10]|uniref:Ribosomal RNA small subunit methyltransferase H n=1 Tax=Candidatus Kaiserbacteria bacterium CG10_big_fil_rev_8_21_14_0_10_44_10 TaxID=1974606 RepID=A0A2H0UHC6_9BACT|nr:MAG: 16S rRNA (cytosine(1402)-N(4))-methyltransferase [Candidatus Kaiserbacteria bacterium CG10_big_fil_rev_8_21_14_0_10_44_10]